jgi:hypothetical protein
MRKYYTFILLSICISLCSICYGAFPDKEVYDYYPTPSATQDQQATGWAGGDTIRECVDVPVYPTLILYASYSQQALQQLPFFLQTII